MPDRIQFEPLGINRDTRAALERKGHVFAEKPGNMGDAEGVMVDPKTDWELQIRDQAACRLGIRHILATISKMAFNETIVLNCGGCDPSDSL